jgi:hypothetical protein
VGSGTPEGQSQWSPCGVQVPVGPETIDELEAVVDGYGLQSPRRRRLCKQVFRSHEACRAARAVSHSGLHAASIASPWAMVEVSGYLWLSADMRRR